MNPLVTGRPSWNAALDYGKLMRQAISHRELQTETHRITFLRCRLDFDLGLWTEDDIIIIVFSLEGEVPRILNRTTVIIYIKIIVFGVIESTQSKASYAKEY